jgi:glutamate synthase domain-containing protein 3
MNLGGAFNIASSILNTGFQIYYGKRSLDLQKKYQKQFLLLQKQKEQAEAEAQRELIEAQIEKLNKEYQTELDIAERQKSIYQDWLYSFGYEMKEAEEKKQAELKSYIPVIGIIGIGLIIALRK